MPSSRSQERVNELEAQVKYLQTELAQLLEEKRRGNRSPSHSRTQEDSDESEREERSNVVNSNYEEDTPRRARRRQESGLGDFRVDIPEFEGQLAPDHFRDWLQTVERIFEYREVPENKKVKLVALKLRKYASIWWASLVAKRVRNGKGKIRTWTKIKDKLKSEFFPSHYIQDNYSKLHHLKQGSKSVKEYTQEFEQLLLKCRR